MPGPAGGPAWQWAAPAQAALALGCVAALLAGSGAAAEVATRGLALAVAAVSLQFMLGFAGLASFGQAASVGIGAYAVLVGDGVDAALVLPAAMAAAGLFAAVTAPVCLRTQGVTYIMITLAFGQMAFFVAQAWAPLGGDDGMALSGRSPVLGTALLADRGAFLAVEAACLVLWALVLRGLALSPYGRALRAAAGNPARAAALGFDVTRLRLGASVVGGLGGGLAGFLLANGTEFVSPSLLDWRESGQLLVMVIIGSRGALGRSVEGRLVGAAAGAVGLVAAEEALSQVTSHGALVLGPALVLLAAFGRGGGRR